MTRPTPDPDDAELVEKLARILCDADQRDIPPDRRETMEQTGGSEDFLYAAHQVLLYLGGYPDLPAESWPSHDR